MKITLKSILFLICVGLLIEIIASFQSPTLLLKRQRCNTRIKSNSNIILHYRWQHINNGMKPSTQKKQRQQHMVSSLHSTKTDIDTPITSTSTSTSSTPSNTSSTPPLPLPLPPSSSSLNSTSYPPSIIPILSLTFLACTLSAIDRVAMSIALLPLSSELSLSSTTKGAISSSFSLGYGLAIIPAGLWLSRGIPRNSMAVGVFVWSVGTVLTPWAATTTTTVEGGGGGGVLLLLARGLVGAAESVVLPTVQKILQTWVKKEDKSLATAGIYAGFQLGTILAYVASPGIMEGVGWRGMFYVYGGMGLFWLVPWLLLVDGGRKEEEEGGDCKVVNTGLDDDASVLIECSIDEKDDRVTPTYSSSSSPTIQTNKATSTIQQNPIQILQNAPWKELVTSRGIIAITIAHAANNWGLYNSLAWIPTFYNEQYGLDVKSSALSSITPSIAGVIGGIVAGTLADRLLRSSKIKPSMAINDTISPTTTTTTTTTTNLRKTFQGVALLGPALVLCYLSTHIPERSTVAQALLTLTVGLQAFNAAGYGPACQEKAGERWAGLVYSITSLPGVLFGTLGVYATGRILDKTGQDWSWVFGLNAGVFLVGGLCFVALYDGTKEFE